MRDIPKPGIVLGRYPEKIDVNDSVIERGVSAISAQWGRIFSLGSGRRNRFLKRVTKYGEVFKPLTDTNLQSQVSEVRLSLVETGLRDECVARSFALIREFSHRILGTRHFDTQILGGWIILQGGIAEMATGEGKTLTAVLPICTAAFAGIPVHVITVNDYLVKRDAEWMGPLFKTLGLTVGTILEGMSSQQRQVSYGCDITYTTNKQLAFDYLKDRLVLGQVRSERKLRIESLHNEDARVSRLLLRGLCYAIVDEADSVLIDEARTPLIISRDNHNADSVQMYSQAISIASELSEPNDYYLDLRNRSIILTEAGKRRIAQRCEAANGVWNSSRRREELITQALNAKRLYIKDKHYLVRDGKVAIIDEFTGRLMPDRSWERGLHQLIELKEGCETTGEKETLARISYQQFFRRYLRLAGMTGTAKEVATELRSVYRLKVVTVPTNKLTVRSRYPTKIFSSREQKWAAIVEQIDRLHKQGRPILVGTRSVEASDYLSRLLDESKLPHRVLNARQHEDEAQIVKTAGFRGKITVATNMAGRGTDIKLEPGMESLGGLHVIASECHEARRIDRQLIGRCGRQGDPGSYEFFISLDDELVVRYGSPILRRLITIGIRDLRNHSIFQNLLVTLAQRSAEKQSAKHRTDLLKLDEYLSNALAFAGKLE